MRTLSFVCLFLGSRAVACPHEIDVRGRLAALGRGHRDALHASLTPGHGPGWAVLDMTPALPDDFGRALHTWMFDKRVSERDPSYASLPLEEWRSLDSRFLGVLEVIRNHMRENLNEALGPTERLESSAHELRAWRRRETPTPGFFHHEGSYLSVTLSLLGPGTIAVPIGSRPLAMQAGQVLVFSGVERVQAFENLSPPLTLEALLHGAPEIFHEDRVLIAEHFVLMPP